MSKPSNDTGCSVGGPSCLDCQYSPTHCVYDLPMVQQPYELRLQAATPLLRDGMTPEQVALHIGVDLRTVQRYAKAMPGYQPHGGKPRKASPETVAPLLEQGMGPVSVARELGIGVRTASRYLGELRRERREAR